MSLRDLEEMMAERGIEVDHSTVHRWVIKLLPVLEKAFRRRQRPVGNSWRMDESVSRTQAKACDAVLKMGVGLPKPACRSRLRTARCCCVRKISVFVKLNEAGDAQVFCVLYGGQDCGSLSRVCTLHRIYQNVHSVG
ncbi:hypothetical protein OKW34_003774 [Paraburkholderia youngii]